MGVAGSGRADGDGLDFEACAARQGGGLDAGARGERRGEHAGIDLVHCREIGEVGEEDRGLDDAFRAESGGGENREDVREGAFRLRGGDPEATPVVVSKPVTVNAGATPPAPTGPELTGVHAPGIESPMIRVESSVWFDGTGLDGWTEGRDSIWCKNNRAEEAEFVRMDGDGTGAAVEFDGGMLKADEGAWSVLTDLGIVEGSEVRFKVTINGQSAEIVATVAEA